MDIQTMKILNRDAIMNTFQTVLALLLTTSVGFTACQSKTVDPNPATVALTPAGPATVNAGDSTVIRNVPAEVMAYVNAVNQNNLDSLALSFAPDGSVFDVSRRITGRSAIRTWAGNEVIGGTLRVLEINTRQTDRIRLLVHWAPRGSAGWRAWYTFTYQQGKIFEADLQYA